MVYGVNQIQQVRSDGGWVQQGRHDMYRLISHSSGWVGREALWLVRWLIDWTD